MSATELPDPVWGPTGKVVYDRTYRRTKANGEPETWLETVTRVVDGNLGLVDGKHIEPGEREALIDGIYSFKMLPAGRHLWASGVPGRQYLFNCHVSGWGNASEGAAFSDHFSFQLLRSAEGGGVGANYSSNYLAQFGPVRQNLRVHIVCDPSHADFSKLRDAGVLSTRYVSDWSGAHEVSDSREGWAGSLTDLIDTYFRDDVAHQDRVYDVSNVRPEGARLKTFGGTASGPLPFARLLLQVSEILNASHDRGRNSLTHVLPLEAMAIDHALGECVVAGGVRRTARMAVLHWRDPQIFEFINCKRDSGDHWTTNISVEIDQDFLTAIERGHCQACDDSDGGILCDTHSWGPLADDVLTAVVEGMLANGEPGFWNSSLSNVGEPNPVICTNPCGEIALEEWENCNLGHINLDAFVGDWDGLFAAHRLMARFLIRATYGDVNDSKQAAVLARNRRIGVGHFGFQGWVNKMGIKYSNSHRHRQVREEMAMMHGEVQHACMSYAHELRIPVAVKCTTVAPTGSIAKMPGRTEGIHPIYSRFFIKRVRFNMSDREQAKTVLAAERDGYKVEPDVYDKSGNTWLVEYPTKEMLVEEIEELGLDPLLVESSDEISLKDQLAVQAMYQECYADNAVSFTVNVIPGAVTEAELAEALSEYLPRLKGTTVFPDLSRPQAPFERITEEQWGASLNRSVADGVDEDCANGACPVR